MLNLNLIKWLETEFDSAYANGTRFLPGVTSFGQYNCGAKMLSVKDDHWCDQWTDGVCHWWWNDGPRIGLEGQEPERWQYVWSDRTHP